MMKTKHRSHAGGERILAFVTLLIWAYALYAINAHAEPPQAPAPTQVQGFAGFSWGVDRHAIQLELKDDYKLVEQAEHSDWYAGELEGHPVTFGYVYDDADRLVGGSWDFAEATPQAFLAAVRKITSTYHLSDVSFDNAGDETSYALTLPDVVVMHRLLLGKFNTVIFTSRKHHGS